MRIDLKARVQPLNAVSANRHVGPVVYVMSRDQRVSDNYALLAAQADALQRKVPLIVLFVLYTNTGFRAQEHYTFMLKAMPDIASELSSYKIPFLIRTGKPKDVIITLDNKYHFSAVYFDFNPLNGPTALRTRMAQRLSCPVFEVDTHNCVPVWLASNKQEVGARTLRPRINRLLEQFLVEPPTIKVHSHEFKFADATDRSENLLRLTTKVKSNGTQIVATSGEHEAHEALHDFINERLPGYATKRNDPTLDHLSRLSPYLHFGQLSSLRIALEVTKQLSNNRSLQQDGEAILEELIIRKELADNFCYYNSNYTQLAGAPNWARVSLDAHRKDVREFIYSLKQLEAAQTHDPAWNAAQRQLTSTGKMHGYMRMYWAKKVLEWTNSPEEAIEYLIYLNDFYSVDGGDPNGYVGILWSVAGLHDRPWFERQVFGVVRYMNFNGLKRKFKIDSYINKYPST